MVAGVRRCDCLATRLSAGRATRARAADFFPRATIDEALLANFALVALLAAALARTVPRRALVLHDVLDTSTSLLVTLALFPTIAPGPQVDATPARHRVRALSGSGETRGDCKKVQTVRYAVWMGERRPPAAH